MDWDEAVGLVKVLGIFLRLLYDFGSMFHDGLFFELQMGKSAFLCISFFGYDLF